VLEYGSIGVLVFECMHHSIIPSLHYSSSLRLAALQYVIA